MEAGIEDLFYFPLLVFVDDHWWWWWWWLLMGSVLVVGSSRLIWKTGWSLTVVGKFNL